MKEVKHPVVYPLTPHPKLINPIPEEVGLGSPEFVAPFSEVAESSPGTCPGPWGAVRPATQESVPFRHHPGRARRSFEASGPASCSHIYEQSSRAILLWCCRIHPCPLAGDLRTGWAVWVSGTENGAMQGPCRGLFRRLPKRTLHGPVFPRSLPLAGTPDPVLRYGAARPLVNRRCPPGS